MRRALSTSARESSSTPPSALLGSAAGVRAVCNRLTYQLINPWSTANYPYVKAAILSTFSANPCGDCATTSKGREDPTFSTSTTERGVLPRHHSSWKTVETPTLEEAARIVPLPANSTSGINTLDENIVSINSPINSVPYANVTRYRGKSIGTYYQYSTIGQQENVSNVHNTSNIDIHTALQEIIPSNSNNSENNSRVLATDTESTSQNVGTSDFPITNTLNIITNNTHLLVSENKTTPQTQEKPSKYDYAEQSLALKLVNASANIEKNYFTAQPHDSYNPESLENTSFEKTKVKHHKHVPEKYKTPHSKKHTDKSFYVTSLPQKKVRNHHHINRENTNTSTSTENTEKDQYTTPTPTVHHHDLKNKCKHEPTLPERSTAAHTDPGYLHNESSEVSTEATTTFNEPTMVGYEEITGGSIKNIIMSGLNYVKNEISKSINHDAKSHSQKPKKCHTQTKLKGLQESTTAMPESPSPTPLTINVNPMQRNGHTKGNLTCPKYIAIVIKEGMRTERMEATEEETVQQYEQLQPWLDYLL